MTDTVPDIICEQCKKVIKPGRGRIIEPPITATNQDRIRVCSKRCRDKIARVHNWGLLGSREQ